MEEIAEEFGVHRATLYRWMENDREFCDTINESRSYADSMVEDALYRRALGGTTTERRKIGKPDSKGNIKAEKVEIIEKEVLPDTAACIFWLKNRQPDKWRDKPDEHIQIDMTIEDDAMSVSLEEFARESLD